MARAPKRAVRWHYGRAAAKVLSQNGLGKSEIKQGLARAAKPYAAASQAQITNPSWTVAILLEVSQLNIALYDCLTDDQGFGYCAERAEALLEQINWRLLKPLLALVSWPGLRHSPLQSPQCLTLGRAQTANRRLWKTLFTRPFAITDKSTANEIAFDVTRCPLAEYYAAQNRANICKAAACNLDYRMAEFWNLTLKRTQTLSGGGRVCDFCFRSDMEN